LEDGSVRLVPTENLDPIGGTIEAFYRESYASVLDVKTKFHLQDRFVDSVVNGRSTSFLLYGGTGTGKSVSVLKSLDRLGYQLAQDGIEGKVYAYLKGKVSPYGLYCTLYRNRNGLVVIDDVDDMWKNPVLNALLKASMDSTGHRIISWEGARTPLMDDSPTSFVFEGKVIIITNATKVEVKDAIVGRTLSMELELTKDQMVERMKEIAPYLDSNLSPEERVEVLDYIVQNQKQISAFSLRTLVHGFALKESNPDCWKMMLMLQ